MRGLLKLTVLLTLLIVCTQTVSAISLSSISVEPSGSLTPDTQVNAIFKIDAGDGTDIGELQLSTNLEHATWTYTIIVSGIENVRPVQGGYYLVISGFELGYKNEDVSVRVTLTGVAPSVTETTEKTIVKIAEYDTNEKLVTSSQVEKKALVINTQDVSSKIESSAAELQIYRTHIDEKAALNIDTSAAELKYTEAQQKIDSARSRTTSEYTEIDSDLATAKTAIDDGETALDKAWAENEVAAAQASINNVDAIIGWFKGNTSTANDQQLSTIITKREVAVSYISNANDNIADGEYAQARQKAQDALLKADESYTEALQRQKELSSGWSIPFLKIGGTVTWVIVIVAVILVAVGGFIYWKRSQWDELG